MSWVIWITAAPGDGAAALARATAEALQAEGLPVRVLELDEVARTLIPAARHTEAERDVLHRALGLIAALLAEAGVCVIVAAAAPRRAWRDLARAAIPRFAEVELARPRPADGEREPGADPASSGGAAPGTDPPYERPLAPELVVNVATTPLLEAVGRVVGLARALGGAEPAPARPERAGWAMWITGRPGSGKTSLAARAAHALAAQGVPVRILDLTAVRRFLLREPQASETEQEVAHRALAYAARHLTEAGTAVIVDATAPRRAWRETARALIPRFAEVQLVCSSATCVERERAARWGLGLQQPVGPPRPGALGAPDMALDYEESIRAELTLHTDTHDLWTTVEQVLFLARRLHSTSARVG